MGDDSCDSNDELQELLAEYETKAIEKKKTIPKIGDRAATSKSTDDVKHREAERTMEKVLFGDKKGLLKNFARAIGEQSDDDDNDEDDDDGDAKRKTKKKPNDEEDAADQLEAHSTKNNRKRKPAWVDPDDEDIQVGPMRRASKLEKSRMDKTYKEYLTKHFTRVVVQPKWARPDNKAAKDDSDDDEILNSVGFLAKPAVGSLPQRSIQCKRLKDLNRSTVAQYSGAAVTSIQFHPTSTAALVAANNGLSTIYSIDGQTNEKLHSMLFHKFPIKCAKLKPCGTKAIFGSIHNYYYQYDLMAAKESRHYLPKTIQTFYNMQLSPCGRFMISADGSGSVHLLSTTANELIHTFNFGETVTGMKFTANSQRIICNSRSSTVKIFSMKQQQLEHMFIDDGCISGRVLDLSPNQRLLATGSNEGVVNVYDYEKVFASQTPQPEKCFLNLTTAITDVKFNHSSELLAMCSKMAPNATKLAHFPSATVYADYPLTNQRSTSKVRLMEFSPNSGYLALGCLNKEIPLMRLKHFNNY